jgi:hypothetical protein
MVGKSTEIGQSFETYLEDANFIEAFKKVREEALSLTDGKFKATVQDKDAKISELTKKLEDAQRQIDILANLLKKELREEARKEGVIIGKETGEEATATENLRALAENRRMCKIHFPSSLTVSVNPLEA